MVLNRGLVRESDSPLADRVFKLDNNQAEIDFRNFFREPYSEISLGVDKLVATGLKPVDHRRKDSACLPECPVPSDVLRVWIILNKSFGNEYICDGSMDPFGYCQAMRSGGKLLCWRGQISLLDSLLRKRLVLLIHRILHLADRMMKACAYHRDSKEPEDLFFECRGDTNRVRPDWYQ